MEREICKCFLLVENEIMNLSTAIVEDEEKSDSYIKYIYTAASNVKKKGV